MSRFVKILILEDVVSDVMLLEYQLKKADFKFELKTVKTEKNYLEAIHKFKPDLILSDYNLPGYSGLEAMNSAIRISPHTPFIFVTGVLDEKTAVNFLKKGAWDYILKENFVRLIPAIENALKLKEEKDQLQKTQKILEQSNAKYLDLYEHAPDMFFTFNFNSGIITECNQTLTNKTGYKKPDLIGHSIFEFYTDDFFKTIKKKFVPIILKKGKIENGEIQIIKKDKSILYGMINASAEYDSKGFISDIRIVVRDVTEIRKKESQLKLSEERFKLIFDKSSDSILILDAETEPIPIIINANKAAKQFIFNSDTVYSEKNVSVFVPHIPEKELIENIIRIKKGETIREKITLNVNEYDTLYFDIIANLIYLDDKKCILITARNITEQHTASLKLTKQKEKFKSLYKKYQSQNKNLEKTVLKLNISQKQLSEKIAIINRSPVVSFSWNNEAGWPVNYVSKNASKIFGWSAEEFMNHDILFEQIIFPEDLPRVKKEIKDASDNKLKHQISHKSYRIITKDNTIKWVKDDTVIIRKNGEIINYEGIVSDITETVEYQQALKRSEKKYRLMLDTNPDIVLIISKDKKILYMNPKAVEKFGFIEPGSTCYKSLFGFNRPCEWCGQEFSDKYENVQNEINIPGDDKRYLTTFSKINENNGQSTYMTSYKDVSELRQLQTERLQFLNALEIGLNEVYLLDSKNFKITYVNTEPVQNLGFSKEEIIKRKLYEFQTNQTNKNYKKYLKRLNSGKINEVYFETYQKRKNGETYPVSVYLKLIKKAGQSTLLAFVNDISEKKQKDEKIKLLSTAISQSPTEVIITDIDGNIEYVNPIFETVTGYSPSEVTGKNPRILKSGKQTNEFYKEMWDTISSGKIWKGEIQNKKKNGDLYWENTVINPVKNTEGKIKHYIALKEDITVKKKMHEKLIQSELQFRLLFENSLLGIYMTTPDGKILNANKALCRMLGYDSCEEFRKLNLETDKEIAINRFEFKKKIETDGFVVGFESIWSDKNKRLLYVRESAGKYKNEKGQTVYEGTVEDITNVKLAEKAVKEIHEFNKQIIRVGKLGYAIYDIKGNCITANKTYAEIIGVEILDVLKQNFKQKENWIRYQLIEEADKCLKTGIQTKRIIEEKSSFDKNVWIELNLSRTYKGNKPQLLAIIKDISPYMNAKRQTIQTKSEYFNLIERVNVPIFGIDTKGIIKEWNSAIETLSGYSRNEVKRKNFKDLFLISNNDISKDFFNNAFFKNTEINREIEIRSKKGKLLKLLISSTLQLNDDDAVNGVIFVAQDITAKEQYKTNLERQVKERTKDLISSLKKEKELSELKSQFVSMASHEFRTPLSAIKFAAGFIKKYYDRAEKEKIEQKADKIELQVNHMTNLLEDVLTIGKIENGKMKFESKELDLIEELQLIIEDILIANRQSHKINFKYKASKCIIISDDKILRNIFVNLLSNAIKFSPEVDEVFLTLKVSDFEAVIEVEDKGIGIKPAELKKIFSPFQRGENVETIQGTGLGLAIVKESISLLKGNIKVESEVGKGTKFTVVLPKDAAKIK